MRLSQCMRLLAVVFLTGSLVGFPVLSGEVLARGGGGGGQAAAVVVIIAVAAAVIIMAAVTAMAVTLAAAASGANRVTRGANTRETIIGPTPPTSM